MVTFIILAAGNGKRMQSDMPKVLMQVRNKSMLVRIVENCAILATRILIVVSPTNQQAIKDHMQNNDFVDLEYVVQDQQIGTGHAVQCCMPHLSNKDDKILILNGDIPLITSKILSKILKQNIPCLATTQLYDPTGYGRVLLIKDRVISIIEEPECNEIERKIQMVNVGIYLFNYDLLHKYIFRLNNTTAEIYLPDLARVCINNGVHVNNYNISNAKQRYVRGVNTMQELKMAEYLCYNEPDT